MAIPRRRAPMRRRRPARRVARRAPMRRMRSTNASYNAPKNFVETIKYCDLVSGPVGGGDPSAGTPVNITLVPSQTLSNLTDILSKMYAQYAIRGIKLSYVPAYTEYSAQSGIAMAPKIYYAQNKVYDISSDTVYAGNITRFMTQNDATIFEPTRRWSRYIALPRPKLDSGTLGASTSVTAVAPTAKTVQWLTTYRDEGSDTVSGLDVQHLAANMIVAPNNSTVDITLGTLYAKVYYACKEQARPPVVQDVSH